MSAKRYLELNGKYLGEAEEFLPKGDLVQASEKLWGASAEIVKAVAAKRGSELGTHASLWEYVSELSKEHPEWGLLELFSIASALHTNYHEGWMTLDAVKANGKAVKQFGDRLKKLL